MAQRRAKGEGSITQRKDGTWQSRIIISKDITGKAKFKYFYGKSQQEVAKKLKEAIKKIDTGYRFEHEKMTVKEWMEEWLNKYRKNAIRDTTWASYETQVRVHINPEIGDIKLSELKTEHIQDLLHKKQKKGGRGDKKDKVLSPRSIKYIYTTIHAALDKARELNYIVYNPANAVELPKKEKKDIEIIPSEKIKDFLAVSKETNYYEIYLVCLATGIRRGEVLGLKWSDVDFDKKCVTIKRNLVRVTGKGLVEQEPKTKLSYRTIGLSDSVLTKLKLHKEKQEGIKAEIENYEDNDYVFCIENGKPIDPRNLERHFKSMLKKAGIKPMGLHSLRHTFATMQIEKGVNIKTIQEILGHHDAGFTWSTYSHVTSKMRDEAHKKTEEWLPITD